MISASRRWLRRNRTPIAIGFGLVGAGYVATQYVLGKISDARARMSSDRIARENLRRRFEQNQEDCTFTVLALLPTATDNIMGELETERITFELQQQKAAKLARNGEGHPSELGSSPPSVTDDDGRSMASLHSENGMHVSKLMGLPTPSEAGEGSQDGGHQVQKSKKTKLQLWNDLKISSITRAFTLIYTLALLTLLTRIQLNLLGRRSYLSSVVSLATGGMEQSTISLENHDDDNPDQAYGNDFETNRKYLTFSWWLLHRGWREVMLKVEAAVKEVFGTLSIRDDVSMQKFSELTLEVRKKVEGATEAERKEGKWLQYLLPPREQEDFVLTESGMTAEAPPSSSVSISSSSATPLRRLLDETSDLIESPPFSHVLTLLLDAGYSTLVDQKIAQQVYKIPLTSDVPDLNAPRITEIVDVKPVKLPIVLALLTRQAHSIGNGVPNEYLQAMEQVRDLEAFAAVVYSSNWENEISPMTEESAVLVPKETVVSDITGLIIPAEASEAGQESIIDVGTASTFESAWGKAVDTTEKGKIA
ncbi:related to PEX3-peroxisomal assembly protein-peroxin [Phialocephala subalpina]|uniref:Related to PEX3-peroxisomal assembly protein-peroxin n=1 Tax=Phialocephala subalpina TaxID=576137 RepID=A0A1L7X2A4_9HELO|nr:related to PEX3-peroxisomal assembly protein-peroxin [Phialocephala subalpina]